MRKPVSKFLCFMLAAMFLIANVINLTMLNAVYADNAAHIVISEIYGGGGNSGATYKNDFVELYNPTATEVSLEGWSVQYASATGTSYQITALTGTIAAYSYYLVQEAKGSGGTVDLPTPDAVGTIAMSATAGKVALVSSTTALVAGALVNVVDYVGFGSTATVFEGAASAPAPSNTTCIERLSNDGADPTASGAGKGNGWDTDNNNVDFIAHSGINPQNSLSTAEDGTISKDEIPPVIVHEPISEGLSDTAIKIDAQITDESTFAAKVYYGNTSDGSTFTSSIDMEKGDGDNYSAQIPGQQPGDLYYYIKATDSNENTATNPEDITSCNKVTVKDTANDIISINEARGKAIDNMVSVSGIVTFVDGTKVYIQDSTAAIVIDNYSLSTAAPTFTVGDKVKVNGKLALYKQLLTIIPPTAADIAIETNGNELPVPKIITIDKANSEAYEAQLAKICNATLGTINTSGNTPLTDKVGTTNIYKIPVLSDIVEGDTVDVIAIVSQYSSSDPASGYQLRVRSAIDVQKVETNEDVSGPVISGLTPKELSSTDSNLRPVISASYSDASGVDKATAKLFLDDIEITSQAVITDTDITYNPTSDLALGDHTAKVEIADTIGNKSEEAWSFSVGEAQYDLYFGQLHSHTTNSDGVGTLDDAYSHAKDVAGVDFLAVTDHSNSFDNASTSTMADGSKSVKWNNGLTAADKYTSADFVGIYAFEMTWSNGTGHINTYNTPGFENRDNSVYKAADGLQQYYNVLKNYPDSISQFNHPGTTFGDFNDFAYYDPVIDNRITLIEVGNGEGEVGSSGYFPSYEYYTRALDKGWHVSPTNNQDNHKGLWGDANTARTVVLAQGLTRNSIYAAIKNMRTYATEDNNLRINYSLNGEKMGTIIEEKPSSINIKVDLEDPDNEALGKVSVVSNGGKIVATKTLSTSKDTVEFTLTPDYSYYYIRVDEADKDIAVTAPVWVGEVEKAGISSTTGSTSLPIKGEKMVVTTNLFNNEKADMVINSLEYSIDGEVFHTAPALADINPYSASSYSFDYTPATAGKYSMDVKLIASIDGVEKIFTDVLKLDVVDPAIVTKVVVDASHNNDYVSGYYSGNMTNLIALGNNEKINVCLQKDKLTDEALEDAQLLILSPPAKKNGTANGEAYTPSPYTDEDIAVIKKFADNGGNIIVTGLADYQDNRNDSTNHSTYQQNRILEAIGSESRINDDEVVDYDNNPNVVPSGEAGGTPYRVPMNVYNTNSLYLANVDPAQNYSFYSGCSIIMGSNATWLVKGTSSTYGFDSDNDTLGGSYVSNASKTIPADTGIGKGNVVALAAETLPGGGSLFIAGTVFYSNFEIKAQLDNASQTQNSNYNITMNILDSIKKVIPVTPINLVRSAQTGDTYCVEGIVTAGTTPGNAFFDTIYIQDQTGGINIFPVSGIDIKVGQKVKVIGTVDEYQGDKELKVIEISVTDASINPVEPTAMTTIAAMDPQNGGMLVMVRGNVTKMDDQNLYINDGSGDARVFVDGYIGDGSGDSAMLGKWSSSIKVGDRVRAIGLASQDAAGYRLRVRNTAEIVWISRPKHEKSSEPDQPIANSDINVTVPAPSISNINGEITAAVEIDESSMTAAILSAQEDTTCMTAVIVDIPEISGADAYELTLPSSCLSNASTNTVIEMCTALGTLEFPTNMLTSDSTGQTQDVSIMVGNADINSLPQEIRDEIGDRPVLELSMKLDGAATAWSNPDAPVTITLDYTPTAQELQNPDSIVVWYIDGSNNIITVSNGRYDPTTGKVTFTVNHFSKYAVTYVEKAYQDIEKYEWAEKEINAMTAKDIIKERSQERFDPATGVTRAEFMYGLVKALGLSASVEESFYDIGLGDYYYNELAIAKKLGIAKGIGNNKFNPTAYITRQDMMTLTFRAMEAAGKLKDVVAEDIDKYTDSAMLAEYAKESAAKLLAKGIIIGDGNNIMPLKNTSRAEAAVILYRIYNTL